MLLAVDFATDAAREVVLVWPEGEPAAGAVPVGAAADFLPNRALAGAAEGAALAAARARGAGRGGEGRAAAAGRPRTCASAASAGCPAIAPEKLASQIAPIRPYR